MTKAERTAAKLREIAEVGIVHHSQTLDLIMAADLIMDQVKKIEELEERIAIMTEGDYDGTPDWPPIDTSAWFDYE